MRRALFAASVVAVVVAISACSSIEPVAEAAPPAPVDPGPQPTETAYATSGWQLQTDILSPLEDRIHVDLETAEVDASGLALYRDLTTGEVAHHPIVNAQYAMTAIREYDRTGDEKWLSRAVRNAEELIATRVEREGAWWYQYDWDWTYLERTLVAPWWSGMAQGEALFVFSRLAMMQPDNPAWREAADRTWDSFPQRGWRNTEPWSTVVLDGNLWFEEYVKAYTNAATILRDDFVDTDDLDGLFSGYDHETGEYDTTTWQYEDGTVHSAAGKRATGTTLPLTNDPQQEVDLGYGSRGMNYTLQLTVVGPFTLESTDAVLSLSEDGQLTFTADGWPYPIRSVAENDGFDPAAIGRIWANATSSTHEIVKLPQTCKITIKTDVFTGSRVWVNDQFVGRFEVFVYGGRNRVFSWSQMAFVAPLDVIKGAGLQRIVLY